MMSKNDFINALLELGFEKDPDYNSTYSKDGISIFLGDTRIIGINFSVHDLKSHASDFETMIGYLKKLTNLSIIHEKEIKESEMYPGMVKEIKKEYMFTFNINELKYIFDNNVKTAGKYINNGTLIGTKEYIREAILKIVNEIDKPLIPL